LTVRPLESLRAQNRGHTFDPDCLTEDYETGLRVFAAGYRQNLVPVRLEKSGPVATREYFPRRWLAAIRQRSRWVAGIALQGWKRHGWCSTGRQCYWFWRDPKGLAANLIAPLAGLQFVRWLASLTAASPGCLLGRRSLWPVGFRIFV
jgi:adsorption protein B